MSDMPYNLVGVSLQTTYTTKDGPRGPSFAFYETIMSYLPVTAPQGFLSYFPDILYCLNVQNVL